MRKISLLPLLCCGFLLCSASAQVLPSNEIKDPELRALQERNMDELKQLGSEILKMPTDYPFYLSRKLDLEESKQKWADQRALQFDRYKDKVVLKITGNYFAAYSAEKMNSDQRARETFLRIVLPILQIEITHFGTNQSVQGYALEISHHVIGKVQGMALERPENLVIVLPQAAAVKLTTATEDTVRQAALLQGEIFMNAKPATIWLSGEAQALAQATPPDDPSTSAKNGSLSGTTDNRSAAADPNDLHTLVHTPVLTPAKPARDISPQALASLQSALKPILDGMVKELDPQAHFASYASPSFIAFRGGVYLELSINTTLTEPDATSRYRLAALAFDDHIAHLIRPTLGYFKDDSQFDGVGFSSTLHLPGKSAANMNSEAVEFFFPFAALRCYERYDCTGQQLIDAGTVLINGERVSLDLQIAEGSVH